MSAFQAFCILAGFMCSEPIHGSGINGNDPLGVPIEGVGEIRYGPKGEPAARLLAYHLPGATLVDDSRKGKKVDVSLGRQFVDLTNDAEVVAQLAEPSPSPSPEGCPLPAPSPSTSGSPAP